MVVVRRREEEYKICREAKRRGAGEYSPLFPCNGLLGVFLWRDIQRQVADYAVVRGQSFF
jgi:hypothetical protein